MIAAPSPIRSKTFSQRADVSQVAPRNDDPVRYRPIELELDLGYEGRVTSGQVLAFLPDGVRRTIEAIRFQEGSPSVLSDGKRVTVVKVGGKMVDVDLNHPMAGKTLAFDVEIVSVRAAAPEELEHGHAHGPSGHQH